MHDDDEDDEWRDKRRGQGAGGTPSGAADIRDVEDGQEMEMELVMSPEAEGVGGGGGGGGGGGAGGGGGGRGGGGGGGTPGSAGRGDGEVGASGGARTPQTPAAAGSGGSGGGVGGGVSGGGCGFSSLHVSGSTTPSPLGAVTPAGRDDGGGDDRGDLGDAEDTLWSPAAPSGRPAATHLPDVSPGIRAQPGPPGPVTDAHAMAGKSMITSSRLTLGLLTLLRGSVWASTLKSK